MGAILYRQFSEGQKPFLTLAGEEYVRPLGIGYTDWQTLRLTMTCAIAGVSNTATLQHVKFFFGLCAGANSWASRTCDWAIGVATIQNTNSSTAAYNAGPPPYYAVQGLAYSRRNGVLSADGVSMNLQMNVAGPTRSFVSVFIQTSGSSFLVSPITPNTVPSTADWDFPAVTGWGDLLSRIPTAFVNGASVATTGNQGSTTKYVNGPLLDSVNIYWNKVATPLEIYSITVSRCA